MLNLKSRKIFAELGRSPNEEYYIYESLIDLGMDINTALPKGTLE